MDQYLSTAQWCGGQGKLGITGLVVVDEITTGQIPDLQAEVILAIGADKQEIITIGLWIAGTNQDGQKVPFLLINRRRFSCSSNLHCCAAFMLL